MKILLVDDSKSARYALRLQLQRHGADVETAESAETALEKLRGDRPDGIFMDRTMPGMNGLEAFDAIRADPRTASIPVIICTSQDDADTAAAAQRKGVFDILPKSSIPEMLPDILARLKLVSKADRAEGLATPAAAPNLGSLPGASVDRAPPAAPPGLSEADAIRLIDARIQSRLAELIQPLVDDLRRDLGERLLGEALALSELQLGETRRQLEGQIGDLRASLGGGQTVDEGGDVDSLIDRITRDTLPDMVTVAVESERAEVLALVDQCLNELRPKGAKLEETVAAHLAAFERSFASKARRAARRAAKETVQHGVGRLDRILDAALQQMRRELRLIYYGLVAAALIAAIAAVAAKLLIH